MRVNPRMDGCKPHQCKWVYLSGAIPCVCLHASDAAQADVRMSVSFPFPACLRHMGSRC